MLGFSRYSKALMKHRSYSSSQRGAVGLLLNEYGEILMSNRKRTTSST